MELPRTLSLVLPNPRALEFLDGDFDNLQDLLLQSSTLISDLNHDVSNLNHRLLNLRQDLTKLAVSWITTSLTTKLSLDDLRSNLENLTLPCKDASRDEQRLVVELCRIQNTRRYFLTVLKLETLVGDLEDSVFHKDLVMKHKRFEIAVRTMNEIEETVGEVTRDHTKWRRLVDSVDSRVDKSLSVLKPQVIAEHRALLSSLGWPPKLSTFKAEHEEVTSIPNPLHLMHGDQKESYAKSFILMCGLQRFCTRKDQRKKSSRESNVGLWAIDELVIPVASRMEHHFVKWTEQPEFIFALVDKVTRDFADGVDDFLQPLIDKAILVSFSAKEAWVSAMVQMLSGFLEKKVFPRLIDMLKEKETKPEAISSWFHLVDQMVTFDKRMQSFISSDTCLTFSRDMSVMGLFCKKREWLKTWGKIELKDAYRKMTEDVRNEKAWVVVDNESNSRSANYYFLSTREDYKAPIVAESFLSRTRSLIDRGLSLPDIDPRIRFVKATAAKFLWYVFKILLFEFKKLDLSDDEDTLIRACGPINSARYLESKLREWSDDLVLVEMCETEGCFFGDELKGLVDLETTWLMEIITVCLHQFDNLCSEHFRYDAVSREDEVITGVVAEALDGLRRNLCVLQLHMNQKDFLDLWRNLAEGLDHYVSRKLFSGETVLPRQKLNNRFEVDAEALLTVFRPYCVRPVAFFPRVREILTLTRMHEDEKARLRGALNRNRNSLSLFGISNLSAQLVELLVTK